jgi:hypothetical protein
MPVPGRYRPSSGVAEFPMYGNADWGDCVEAGGGHALESLTRYGTGTTVVVSDADVLRWYSDVAGFDPNAGPPGQNPTDQGTMIADFLDYWRKTGLNGHKILAHGMVKDPAKVKAALNVFGILVLGVDLPQSAEDQFNAGQPWTVVAGSPILGGHCLVVPYYAVNPDGITWANKVEITASWWTKYVTEVHFVVAPEWVSATAGTTPSGVNWAGLGVDFTALTGEPVPWAVPPSPTPAPPSPTPSPGPTPADEAFAAILHKDGWVDAHHVGDNHHVAVAAKAWLARNGL